MNTILRKPLGLETQIIAAVDELAWQSAAQIIAKRRDVDFHEIVLCPAFVRALARFALGAPDEAFGLAAPKLFAKYQGIHPITIGIRIRELLIDELTSSHVPMIDYAIREQNRDDAESLVRAQLDLLPARDCAQEESIKTGFHSLAVAVGHFEEYLAATYKDLETDCLSDPMLAGDFVSYYGDGSSCYAPYMLSKLVAHAIKAGGSERLVAKLLAECFYHTHWPSLRAIVALRTEVAPFMGSLEDTLTYGGIMPSECAFTHFHALKGGWDLIRMPPLFGDVEF